tara:strand:- start:27 stop:623 length:597 start_codon:yes stop_codon:yes gene_type:complete
MKRGERIEIIPIGKDSQEIQTGVVVNINSSRATLQCPYTHERWEHIIDSKKYKYKIVSHLSQSKIEPLDSWSDDEFQDLIHERSRLLYSEKAEITRVKLHNQAEVSEKDGISRQKLRPRIQPPKSRKKGSIEINLVENMNNPQKTHKPSKPTNQSVVVNLIQTETPAPMQDKKLKSVASRYQPKQNRFRNMRRRIKPQ